MRKLKLRVQMTLDGFVAGPNSELDWMWIGKRDESILQRVIDLADTCDTILLGRKMTRGFIDHWEKVLDNQSASVEPTFRPVAIGSGLSIFKEQRLLELDSSISYKNGTLLNKYLPSIGGVNVEG